MTYGFDSAILLISSYANPVHTLEHARKHGYQVTDFMVSPMPFGYYSSEPKVLPLLSLQTPSVRAITICRASLSGSGTIVCLLWLQPCQAGALLLYHCDIG